MDTQTPAARRGGREATWLLILICLVVFPFGLADDSLACSFNNVFILGRWWTIFTAIFVHGSILHLLGNMVFLLLFGRALESYIGAQKLLAVFFIGGSLSMLLSIFYYPPDLPCVGASGAICTILATVMLFNPWRLSFLLFMFPMPLGVAGFTFLLLNLGGFFMDRYSAPANGMHVAYLAHLIGFLIGIGFGILLSPDWKKNLLMSILQFIAYYLIIYWILYFFRRH
jgi:membrane associated rhomboid family serine protease